MSREIKFRVWDEVIHDWHATKAIAAFTDRCNKGYNFNIVCFGNPKRTFIEQYIGLEDRNGKEIYEGDIVEDTLDGLRYEVRWIKYEARFIGVRKSLPNWYPNDTSWVHIEIIGNIHENPELLEDKK